jgi:hypothetical protein
MIRKINLEQNVIVADVSNTKLSTNYNMQDSLEIGIVGYVPRVPIGPIFDYGDPTYFATPTDYVIQG